MTHLRKSEGKAIYRAMGSLAFVAAARAVYAVAADPEDASERRRLFLPLKNNIGNDREGFAYARDVEDEDGVPTVKWEPEPIAITAEQAMGAGTRAASDGVLAESVDWLRDALAGGPRPAKELFAAASDEFLPRSVVVRDPFSNLRLLGGREVSEAFLSF